MACRGVHEPPGIATRGLVTWAIDLWPYVNGKALTHGINLKEIEASNMVDVIHYFFEEDMVVESGEVAEAKDKMRSRIYSEMYQTKYKYVSKKSKQGNSTQYGGEDIDLSEDLSTPSDVKPFNPKSQPTKAYVPPTEYDPSSAQPFGLDLDAPLK